MMQPVTELTETADFALLLELNMGIDGFSSDWAYCDRLSSYVARMVSHNRTDSLLYANLFSSALNEILETIFRLHRPGGDFACSVSRKGAKDRIILTIPADPEVSRFYRDAIRILDEPNVADRYRDALFSEGPLKPDIGLLELAVDYNARLSVEIMANDSINLIAELTLEDSEN